MITIKDLLSVFVGHKRDEKAHLIVYSEESGACYGRYTAKVTDVGRLPVTEFTSICLISTHVSRETFIELIDKNKIFYYEEEL